MRLVQSVLDFPTHAHSQSLVHAISFGIDDHLEALWQAPGGLTKPRLKTQPAELGFSLFRGSGGRRAFVAGCGTEPKTKQDS